MSVSHEQYEVEEDDYQQARMMVDQRKSTEPPHTCESCKHGHKPYFSYPCSLCMGEAAEAYNPFSLWEAKT